MRSVKSVGISLVAFALLLFVVSPLARAADDKGIDGTWKWAQQGGRRGGGQGGNGGNDQQQRPAREVTLKLKHDGDKLTGELTRPAGRQGGNAPEPIKIEDGTFKNGEVAFSTSVERNGNKFTTKYKGKLEGDTITGTQEFEGQNGQTRSTEWKATRAKDDDKKPDEKK